MNKLGAVTDTGRKVARKWADEVLANQKYYNEDDITIAHVIRENLDNRMPNPSEVPDEVLDDMWMEAAAAGGGKRGMIAALHILHEHCNTPRKRVVWEVIDAGDEYGFIYRTEEMARDHLRQGGRIVKLVEEYDE